MSSLRRGHNGPLDNRVKPISNFLFSVIVIVMYAKNNEKMCFKPSGGNRMQEELSMILGCKKKINVNC